MADSKDISILFIDGKAIAHSTDRRELIEKAYEIVGDIDDGYPYYSSRTCSLDGFGKCIDWHAGVGWLRNATRVSDGSAIGFSSAPRRLRPPSRPPSRPTPLPAHLYGKRGEMTKSLETGGAIPTTKDGER